MEGQCSHVLGRREQRWPQTPRPRNSSVPSCRSSQCNGLCRATLLVSRRLGGGAATGDLVTDHQESERERRSNQRHRAPGLWPDAPHTVGAVYIRNIMWALPSVGQLDGGLPLSPQGLRGHEALQIKRLFPCEHVIHGPRQLMGEHGQRFGFAVFAFQFGKVRLAGPVLP
jgi:hypothetical protein